MKQQLKWIILACFTLTFFGCEPLPHTEKVGAQQKPTRKTLNFNYDSQFRQLQTAGQATAWEQVFLPHSVRIEPLVVNDQWQGTSIYRKKFPMEKNKFL